MTLPHHLHGSMRPACRSGGVHLGPYKATIFPVGYPQQRRLRISVATRFVRSCGIGHSQNSQNLDEGVQGNKFLLHIEVSQRGAGGSRVPMVIFKCILMMRWHFSQ